MRRTTILLAAILLAAGAAGCSKSADDTARDCAAALTERTGGDAADKPTLDEAEARVQAVDEALADLVRSGHESVAARAFSTLEKKTKAGGEGRPEACEPLSEGDYTTLLTAKSIDGLGWTGEGGEVDKVKMVKGARG
jgi:hypothetical protein